MTDVGLAGGQVGQEGLVAARSFEVFEDGVHQTQKMSLAPDLDQVQLMALGLVLFQQLIYVLALHALAYWIFPRLQAPVPSPPKALEGLIALDPL